MKSIFDEPCAHNVEHMEASIWTGDAKACALRIQMCGKSRFMSDELGGEFVAYGPAEMLDKFRLVAAGINAIFAPPQEAEPEIAGDDDEPYAPAEPRDRHPEEANHEDEP